MRKISKIRKNCEPVVNQTCYLIICIAQSLHCTFYVHTVCGLHSVGANHVSEWHLSVGYALSDIGLDS